MDILKEIGNTGVLPVVVIEDEKDAVATAQALLKGGINAMEVTFRTAAAKSSIKKVAEAVPEMMVGAGTILNLEQCKAAVEAGAKFIVSPGYCDEVVSWCVENNIPITPGVATATEIMMALTHGLKVVKFFPAGILGGLPAMKALSGPFVGLKFIPTGGVNAGNMEEFLAAPFIHAIGGSWLCTKKDIAEGNFDKITALCVEARAKVLGFEVAHIGINTADAGASMNLAQSLNKAFGFAIKEGNSSNFASTGVEIMKSKGLGTNGHIAVRTASIPRAIAELEKKGFAVDMSTAKTKNDKIAAVYLKNEMGGFALHLLQK